jgi:hypothetical protein
LPYTKKVANKLSILKMTPAGGIVPRLYETDLYDRFLKYFEKGRKKARKKKRRNTVQYKEYGACSFRRNGYSNPA